MAGINILWDVLPLCVSIISFSAFVLIAGGTLSVAIAFPVLSAFELFGQTLNMVRGCIIWAKFCRFGLTVSLGTINRYPYSPSYSSAHIPRCNASRNTLEKTKSLNKFHGLLTRISTALPPPQTDVLGSRMHLLCGAPSRVRQPNKLPRRMTRTIRRPLP